MNNGNAILTIMEDEYTKEKERMSVLENKAITLLTILMAMLVLYTPMIPFEKIIGLVKKDFNSRTILLIGVLIISLVAVGLAVYLFILLIKSVDLKVYKSVNIELLLDGDEYFYLEEKEFWIKMSKHYKNIILANRINNDEKQDKLAKSFKLIIYVFVILIFSIVLMELL